MDTMFASAFRSSPDDIALQSEDLQPVVDELLDAVGGMIAILNDHRQILALNVGLMRRLGLDDPCPALGLRLGEVLGCVHSDETPGGCGTTKWCRTCGAAIAMVATQATGQPVEQVCTMETKAVDSENELFLRVRCSPLERAGRKLLVLFLQDVTHEQKLALLERTFFHDVNGLVTGILGASDILQRKSDERNKSLSESLHRMSLRLANELFLQSKMNSGAGNTGVARYADVTVKDLFRELSDEFGHSPLRTDRALEFSEVDASVVLFTDAHIVVRVLKNMIVNALEASVAGGAVSVRFESVEGRGVFSVWNGGAIDPDVALRIFQRNFSTKGTLGRGIGTWSMKFFGEQILHGEVSFDSNPRYGTTFQLRLPHQPGGV